LTVVIAKRVNLAPGGTRLSSEAPGGVPWDRVEDLFPDLLAVAPSERAAFLDRACAGDLALRAELESLLRASTSETTLDAPPAFRPMEAHSTPESTAAPESLGVWQVLRLLGRGGMGEVYLAERTDAGFVQRAAVKVLRPEAAAHVQRFEAERRILAQLEHPNIARLLDGGLASSGRPYMAMEYVSGETLTEFAAQHRLGLSERIRLFEQIGRAVAYAHSHLVVHRDLKSSNILVTADGQPKLLDFGIAKLVELGSGSDATLTTAFTPDHAAPEQLQGAPATTAVDVYALGIMLYELLAGVRPWAPGATPLSRVVEKLLQEEPGVASKAAAGNTAAPIPARLLRGDLDAIIAKCLRKAPDARYATVEALLEDLRRYRAHQPLLARGDARGYVVRRWLRRHRIPVAAGALVLLTVLAGLGVALWQARATAFQARRAAEARDFLVGLFESVAPDATLGKTVTAKELLDRGAARVEAGLSGEPALRAEMQNLVGRMYGELGLYKEARPLLEAALAARRASADGASAELAQSVEDLARVLHDLSDFTVAEQLAREAVALRRERARTNPGDLARSLALHARTLSTLAKADETAALFQEALAIDRRGGDRRALAERLSEYSLALWQTERYDDALRAGGEALVVQREVYGSTNTLIATTLKTLGLAHMSKGAYVRAEEYLRESLAMRRTLLGERHPLVAEVLNTLGDNFQRAGRLDDAEAAHREALTIWRALDENHLEVANTLNHIGVVQYFKSQSKEAAATIEQALPRFRAIYGPHHPDVFGVLNNLGAIYSQMGNLEDAERVLRETLALRRAAMGEIHEDVAQSLSNLADLLLKKKAHAEAEATYRQSIAMWRRTLGSEHPSVAYGLMGLGKLLLETDRCAEGEPLLRESVTIRATALDAGATLTASSRAYLAECLNRMGRFAEAEELLAPSVAVMLERWGSDSPFTARAQRALDAARAASTK